MVSNKKNKETSLSEKQKAIYAGLQHC